MRQKRPSKGELELLAILWEHEGVSLAEAHELLGGEAAYTTVQTRLNRMVDKGLASREKVGRRPLQYRAAVQPDEINARQAETLVERMAGGSVVPLVAHLVRKSDLSKEELAELKSLVKEAEHRAKGGA